MLQFVLHVLGYDLWFYISHILLHTRPLYNAIHKVHHTIVEPRYSDTYVGHWAEGPFQSIGFLLPWTIMSVGWTQCVVALVFVNARGMLRHETRLGWLLGNHHLLHHRLPRYNYGEYWLDWLCGTNCKDERLCNKGLLRL